MQSTKSPNFFLNPASPSALAETGSFPSTTDLYLLSVK
jgi:hypothetical protein